MILGFTLEPVAILSMSVVGSFMSFALECINESPIPYLVDLALEKKKK